jgi:drug/metabolite transporter (DMT)-like permease
MTCYFIAIANAPLADATAAYFVGPIVAMALAVLLGERMTPRSCWISLILGFVGALIIVNPQRR